MTNYHVPDLHAETVGGASAMNETVWTKVNVSRALIIESTLLTSEGKKTVKFSQSLSFINEANYDDGGWVQV